MSNPLTGWLIASACVNVLLVALWLSEVWARKAWFHVALDACEGERLARLDLHRASTALIRANAGRLPFTTEK